MATYLLISERAFYLNGTWWPIVPFFFKYWNTFIKHLIVKCTAGREEERIEQLWRKGGNTHSTVSMLQDLKVTFPTVSILFPSTSLQTEIEKRGSLKTVGKCRKRKIQATSSWLGSATRRLNHLKLKQNANINLFKGLSIRFQPCK